MKKLCLLLLVGLAATPAFAQRGVDLILDVEGVRRTGETTDVTPGTLQFFPDFSNGWGAGGGVNIWLSDRVSFEAKAGAFRTKMRVTTYGSDFVINADLGHARLYPITGLLQWHPVENGTFRPYVGVGAAYIILENLNERIGNTSASGIEFNDPFGLLLDAGVRIQISDRWAAAGDIRYMPVETHGRTTFPGTPAAVRLGVKPLIAGFGVVYKF